MLAFSIDYYGIFFGATQSVELFCTYLTQAGFVELPALTSEQIPAKTIEKGTSAFETQMIIKINEIEFYVNENSSSELISRMLEIIRHA